MRITLRRTAMCILLLGLCPSLTSAQQGATNRAVVLRRDPSRTAPIIAHLVKGERLMLVQMTADSVSFMLRQNMIKSAGSRRIL
jgi:hypothetical protein